MRRLAFGVAAVAVAAAGLVAGAAPASAHHSCTEGIPCPPHVCVDVKYLRELFPC